METPIQKLVFPNDRGIALYCKREDLLPFSLGGNKVRIGQAFFQDMLEKAGDCMVVYGNSRSNLCRVLANLCCARGIPCYMICTAERGETSTETNNSRLMKWLGAKVISCEKSDIARTVEDTMKRLKDQGYRPYYIFGNQYGTGNEGTPVKAYVEGYREIQAWEKRESIFFSHIFTASGTGATQSGLISGKLLEHGTEQILGVSISSREYDRAMQVMATSIRSYFETYGYMLPADYENEIHLEMGYRRGGYGLYDEKILDTIREEFRINGLPLDPTYTGKAFLGMKEYIEEKDLRDSNVLFLHTGGTPLFYDCLESAMITK